MSALPAPQSNSPDKIAHDWDVITTRAPRLAATLGRYLTQASTFLAPRSVDAASIALRQFAFWLLDDTDVTAVAAIGRSDVEDFTVWLADQPGARDGALSTNTRSQRLHMLRSFFARIIEWDWDDAPRRNPVMAGDIPTRPEPLPKFLDDRDAAKLMATARSASDPRDRLVVELLARTGLRANEACGLDADAVVRIGSGHWLRVPWASCATTASCRCTPNSSSSSRAGAPPTSTTSAPTAASSPITGAPSSATSWPASSSGWHARPASATFTPTSCVTPSPPRPSTGACV